MLRQAFWYFKPIFVGEGSHSSNAVHLDEGEAVFPPDGYDGLLFMGGPMDVWQEQAHPCLFAEKFLLKKRLREKTSRFLAFAFAINF